MNAQPLPSSIYQFPAVVRTLDAINVQGGHRVRLYTSNGEFDALTWMPPHAFQRWDGRVACGYVVLGALESEAGRAEYGLMSFQRDEQIALHAFISPKTCPIYGVAEQLTAFIGEIQSQPLQHFVQQAMMLDGAFTCFWTCPASLRDHHAYAGGLAQHTLEVTTLVASATTLSTENRDLGVALAVLHDLGKVWAYEEGQLTEAAALLGHERLAYDRLGPLLDELSRQDESTGLIMRALLAGEWRNGARRKRLAIGAVVHAFDQMSCEQERGKRCASGE